MKQLDVLVAAGLMVVTRDGRERWNRLNPVPLQAIVRRWLDPFAADAADALLRLNRVAESTRTPESPPMPATTPPCRKLRPDPGGLHPRRPRAGVEGPR